MKRNTSRYQCGAGDRNVTNLRFWVFDKLLEVIRKAFMKACILRLASLQMITVVGLSSLSAQLTVDDFEDNSKDPTLWGGDYGSPNGRLIEQNGRLEFTSTASFGEEEVSRPYNLTLPADTGWTVTAEVKNSVLTPFNPQIASLGIAVFPTGNSNEEIWIELYASWTAGGASVWGYATQLYDELNSGNYVGNDSGNQIPTNEGQVRLSYNASLRVVTADYLIKGQTEWVELATYGVAGSGGLTGNSNWGLGTTGSFDLTLWGYTDSKTVASGEIYFESITIQGGTGGGGGPPLVANDDTITIRKNIESYEIQARVNDRSLAGAPESIVITDVSESSIGASVSTDGETILYSPPADYLGTETLTYSIQDGDGNADTADIEVSVIDVSYPGSTSDSGLISLMEAIALEFPAWVPYLTLYEKHIAEILLLTLDAQSSTKIPGFGIKSLDSTPDVRAGNAFRQAQLEAIFQMLVEPAVSVLTGETDEVFVSSELVNEIISLREYLQEAGSDILKADIQELVDGAEDRNLIIGRSVAEQAIVDPGSSIVEAFDPKVVEGSRFSISSWNVTGLDLHVWKYDLENSNDWEQMPNTQRNQDGEKMILKVPIPASGSNLYQVRGKRENLGFSSSSSPN